MSIMFWLPFAVAVVNGIPLERAVSRMKRFPGVGGRMQLIQQGQPFQVIIDFCTYARWTTKRA